MLKHKALILAAVISLLVATTTAQAYYEKWRGFFATGTITYSLKTYTFSATGSNGSTVCHSGDRDTFLNDSTSFVGYFINNQGTPDTLILTGTTYSTHPKFYGTKETGQRDTHTCDDGLWCAYTNKGFYIWGTWSATFDYTGGGDPTFSGNWYVVSGTSPVSGGGTVGGYRMSTW